MLNKNSTPKLGPRIKALRKDRKIPATDVAKALNISRAYYSQLESDDRPWKAAHLVVVAKCLGLPVGDLYADKAPAGQVEFLPGVHIPREVAEDLGAICSKPEGLALFREFLATVKTGDASATEAIQSLLKAVRR